MKVAIPRKCCDDGQISRLSLTKTILDGTELNQKVQSNFKYLPITLKSLVKQA